MHKNPSFLLRLSAFLAIFLFIFGSFYIGKAQAAVRTWDGGGDTQNWSDCVNWSDNTCPTSADSVVFNNTSTKNSVIDSSFQGTIIGMTISSGYSGTITQERALVINGSYSQADGNFIGGSANVTIASDGAFSLTGGSFTSTTGILSIERNFTVSNDAVFDATGGTVTFVGNSSDTTTMSCNLTTTFSLVVFNKSGAPSITVGANCVIPMGNSPTSSSGNLNNNGKIIVGTGTWVINANYTQNNGAELDMPGNILDMNGTLTLNGGTWPASIDTIFLNGGLNNAGNLLNHGMSLILDSSGASTLICGDVEFSSVTISKTGGTNLTIGADCILPLGDSPTSSVGNTLINNGEIVVGTGPWTINAHYTQNSGAKLTMSGNVLDVNGSLTLNGGTWPASIDTIFLGVSLNNSGNVLNDGTTLTLDGTTTLSLTCGNAVFSLVTISKNTIGGNNITIGSDCVLPLGDNPSSSISTAIINNGRIDIGTGTWTINGGYTGNSGGMLNMEGNNLSLNGHLVINSGTVFPENLNLSLTGGVANLNCGHVTFSSLIINKTGATTPTSPCTVSGDFNRISGAIANPASPYAWSISGNFTSTTTNALGGPNLTFSLTGSTSTTVSQFAIPSTNTSNFAINKTGGASVTQDTNLTLGGPLSITSGTLDQGPSYNLTTPSITIGEQGTWQNHGTGGITLGGNVSNSGLISLSSNGPSCGEGDSILLRSSSNGVQRNWSGSGTFSLSDLNVQDMTGSITAYSSTNAGNNTWTIESDCAPVPDTTPPTVLSFSLPPTSSSLTVPILSFTAEDTESSVSYLITESSSAPLSNHPDWSLTPPEEYLFSSPGSKTLYAWAMDESNNISTSLSDTVTITLPPDPTHTIGGTLSGLTSTLIIQNNSGDDLSITENGPFTFNTELEDEDTYNVTVLTQPSGQTCNITNGSGTISGANITNISIVCEDDVIPPPPTHTIGGTLSGLTGTLTLQNNLTDNLTLSSNGPFTFSTPLEQGDTYSITILTEPNNQTCLITNPSGTVSSSNITDISITCTDDELPPDPEPEPDPDPQPEPEPSPAPSASRPVTTASNQIQNLINNGDIQGAIAIIRGQIAMLMGRLIVMLQSEVQKTSL